MIRCCSIWFSFERTKKIYHVTGEFSVLFETIGIHIILIEQMVVHILLSAALMF